MFRGEISTFYRSNGGPYLFGIPLTNEIHLPQYPNTAIVPCERAMIAFDPERKIDAPRLMALAIFYTSTQVLVSNYYYNA
ncbi:hypothetical protein KDW_50360 [Dictyobacter vulcani]|uniref:Uncharacterized protein n=1 Tax=Dictyobacter vulcani TaxID=2607529 RepID=A0A5J4KNH7_9CHLR|nr:hypothetical protein [Dictyobacter vulcani]GER90874.1 hypothetical protein KDW_50360 [Dictyobacter vulcani]